MRAIDTNVLVRLLARDDQAQAAKAEEFAASGAWLSHLVLMETIWILDAVYNVKPEKIAEGLEMLLNHDTLVVQEPAVVRATAVNYRKHPSLGFSDCLILEVARNAKHVPLGTFDRDLGRLPGAQRL